MAVLCVAGHAGAQSDPDAVFERVREHLSGGRPGRAVREAEQSIQQNDDRQQAAQMRIRVTRLVLDYYLRRGHGKEAVQEAVQNLVQKSQGDWRELACLMGGRIRVFIGQYEAARKTLNEYLEEFPPPSREQLKQYGEKDESLGETALRHPRMVRRRIAREMFGRLNMIGKKIPPFRVTSLEGEQVTRQELQGSPAVLIFWRASTDKSDEWMNLMAQVYDTYSSRGLRMVGLSVDTDKSRLRSFLEQNELPWPQVYLGGRRDEVTNMFGIGTLYPASLLVDSEGIVRGVDLKGAALGQRIGQLLRGAEESSG
ncbi:MAG: redoxin domain-containing protein [Planctomycetota bacterium]